MLCFFEDLILVLSSRDHVIKMPPWLFKVCNFINLLYTDSINLQNHKNWNWCGLHWYLMCDKFGV